MYKILKSTTTGMDELDLTQLEKGSWIDVVAPDNDELKTLEEQCKDYADDWEYGVTLIRESYFQEYQFLLDPSQNAII